MKKILQLLIFATLWASASQAAVLQAEDITGLEINGYLKVGYRWISLDGSSRSGEYEYFKKSDTLSAVMEWLWLPHRFMLEYHSLNEKDFYKGLDYAYKDVVVFYALSRVLYHNLDHFSFGPDDTGTNLLSFTDRDPGDVYATEKTLNTFFVRLKTPDFPFHLYAEARSFEKEGLIQQRSLIGYFIPLHKVSQSRSIDWRTTETKVGANSHLGPIEVDYSHTEKRFDASGDKVLYDLYPAIGHPFPINRAEDTYPHNLVPDLESSSDTIKIHTSLTGRIVAAGTYTTGRKENTDSNARTDYWNAAGDLTLTPAKDLVIFFKYRHYDLSVENPDTVTMAGQNNTYVYNVRDSISSQRDVMTGAVRYRATERLTVKGEYALEKIERAVGPQGVDLQLEVSPTPGRTTPAYLEVAPETTRGTARLSTTYRVMNRLTLTAGLSRQRTDNPAYNSEPDRSGSAKVTATWTPMPELSALLSYNGVREERDNLGPPLAGGESKTLRDQAMGSVTVLIGKRSSLTGSYAYFRNRVDHTITYNHSNDGTNYSYVTESGVPYADVAHVGSLMLAHAPADDITITAEAVRSYSRGSFRNSGAISRTPTA